MKYSFNIQSQKQTPPLFSLKYPYDQFFMISSLCCSMNVLRKRPKSLQVHVISGILLLTSVISRFHMEERHSQRLLCFIYFDILSFKCTVPTIQSLSTVAMATNLPANVKKRTGVRFNWATMRVCFPDYLVTFHRITFAAQAHSMCFMFTSSDKYTFSDHIFIDTCMQGAKIKCTTLLWLIAHPQNLTP